jgi:hypothetical protein
MVQHNKNKNKNTLKKYNKNVLEHMARGRSAYYATQGSGSGSSAPMSTGLKVALIVGIILLIGLLIWAGLCKLGNIGCL